MEYSTIHNLRSTHILTALNFLVAPNHSDAANLRIGIPKAGGSVTFFKGVIDQVQIFNYGLSATDVSSLYNRAQTKPAVVFKTL